MKEIILNSIHTGVYLQSYPALLPNEQEVEAFEKRIKHQLPPDYRAFLLGYNGGSCQPPKSSTAADGYLAGLYCLKPDGTPGLKPLRTPQDCRKQWPALPEDTLPIGETDRGDLLVILFSGRRSELAVLEQETAGFSLTPGPRDFTSFLINSIHGIKP